MQPVEQSMWRWPKWFHLKLITLPRTCPCLAKFLLCFRTRIPVGLERISSPYCVPLHQKLCGTSPGKAFSPAYLEFKVRAHVCKEVWDLVVFLPILGAPFISFSSQEAQTYHHPIQWLWLQLWVWEWRWGAVPLHVYASYLWFALHSCWLQLLSCWILIYPVHSNILMQ